MRSTIVLVLAAASLAACSSPPLDPDDPTLLARPFTAEQIAGAMGEGTVIDLARATPMSRGALRWTVVEADQEGCVIEYAALDSIGSPVGPVERVRHGWVELRDHASFKAATSTVEDDRRLTPLGLLEGRLYTSRDEERGTVTRMFFVPAYPGPPVWMDITQQGALVTEMQQTVRR